MNGWIGISEFVACLLGVSIGVGVVWLRWVYAAPNRTHLTATHNAQVQQLTAALQEQQQQHEEQTAELTILRQTVTEQDAQLTEQQALLADAAHQQTVLRKTHTTTVAKQEQQLAEQQQIVAASQQELAALRAQLLEIRDVHEDELARIRRELKQQTAQLAKSDEQVHLLEATNTALVTDNARLSEVANEQTDRASTFETNYTNLRNEHEQLKRHHDELREVSNAKTKALAALEEEHKQEVDVRKQVTQTIDLLYQLLHKIHTPSPPVSAAAIPAASPSDGVAPTVAKGKLLPAPVMQQTIQPATQQKIAEFLDQCDFEFTEFPTLQSLHPALEQLAKDLGASYPMLKPFHRAVKRSLNFGNTFTLHLTGRPPESIDRIQTFGQSAHELGLLEFFSFSPQRVSAKSRNTPEAQSFFSGLWMERYILHQVQLVVNGLRMEINQPLDFGYFPNAKGILPAGDLREIDLLFHVNGHFYWVEVKSGGYRQYIRKYSEISSLMKLDQMHAILVVAEMSKRHALFRETHPINIYAMHEFPNRLRATLRTELQSCV
ncbi:MAG: hypothetical protein KDE19_18035 [Caldilineaceae bacterium]|nr:hypothetical protein [Caldilineaceae bacterium]